VTVFYRGLQEINRRVRVDFFEGVVMKRDGSPLSLSPPWSRATSTTSCPVHVAARRPGTIASWPTGRRRRASWRPVRNRGIRAGTKAELVVFGDAILESHGKISATQNMKNSETMLPGLDVLNTGHGEFELCFDPNKPNEVQKAKETITDMLKRGYAIFVQKGEETFRVRKFDVNTSTYIIGSTPAEKIPMAETRAIAVGRSAGG
jgi:hypothetical protein